MNWTEKIYPAYDVSVDRVIDIAFSGRSLRETVVHYNKK